MLLVRYDKYKCASHSSTWWYAQEVIFGLARHREGFAPPSIRYRTFILPRCIMCTDTTHRPIWFADHLVSTSSTASHDVKPNTSSKAPFEVRTTTVTSCQSLEELRLEYPSRCLQYPQIDDVLARAIRRICITP